MNLSAPFLVVLSANEGAALRVLARTTLPLSGREVARLGGAPSSSVARALKRLVEHGLVEVEVAGAGAAQLYTLNRRHLAAEPVLALLDMRRALVRRLAAVLEGWTLRPCHASLFGSAARGDGDTSSDIDIFLVRPQGLEAEAPAWRSAVDELSTAVLTWTGNRAGISEVSLEDVRRLIHERPPIVDNLERDGLTLIGVDVRQLFSGGGQ